MHFCALYVAWGIEGGGIRNPYFFTSDRRIRMRILDPKKVRIRGFRMRMRMRIANPAGFIYQLMTEFPPCV